ncbi:matrixin family metalloprotease, partial [Halobacterium sp. CBA1126]|uniref:matrixin family metalloprotease n=1 Tax=Halobacterium sp. CBA1126 TaxID=2668074 RepID=UPI0012F92DC9
MGRVLVALAVLALVASAGCLAAEPTVVDTDTATDRPSAPFTVTDRPADRAVNPWGPGPITVAVEDHAGTSRALRPAVRETVAFWENETYADDRYRPSFEVVASDESADVRVEAVAAVDRCPVDEADVALGCAPVVPPRATVTEDVTIRVRAGHTRATMRAVLKHEFGHVLGFRHGEGPDGVMTQSLSSRVDGDVADARRGRTRGTRTRYRSPSRRRRGRRTRRGSACGKPSATTSAARTAPSRTRRRSNSSTTPTTRQSWWRSGSPSTATRSACRRRVRTGTARTSTATAPPSTTRTSASSS